MYIPTLKNSFYRILKLSQCIVSITFTNLIICQKSTSKICNLCHIKGNTTFNLLNILQMQMKSRLLSVCMYLLTNATLLECSIFIFYAVQNEMCSLRCYLNSNLKTTMITSSYEFVSTIFTLCSLVCTN